MNFSSRDDVIEWIIKNQFGRRNLSAYDRSLLALKLKPILAAKAKENQIRKPAESVFQKSVKQKPINTQQEIAKAAGVSHDTIAKVEKIEQSATPEIKAALKSGNMSINTAYREVKKAERNEEIQRQVEEIEQKAIEKPDGLFDVIVIDPPWNYGDVHLYHVDGWRVSAPYPEMSQEELKKIELPAADNCVLCIWTTNQFIWDAKDLMDNWGFQYRFMFVWNKQKRGVGRRIRMQCEFCIVGLKGNPVFKDVHDIRDI